MAAHQAPLSLRFSRQEHWSGLPCPSPMHEREKWKWSRSVVSDSLRPHGLQPTRLLHPWDFPGKSIGVGCHCLSEPVSLFPSYICPEMELLDGILVTGLSQWLSGKESAYNAGDTEDLGLISGLGRSPEGGHGSPLQYACVENLMDREAWWTTVHRVAKSQTHLKWLSTHTYMHAW